MSDRYREDYYRGSGGVGGVERGMDRYRDTEYRGGGYVAGERGRDWGEYERGGPDRRGYPPPPMSSREMYYSGPPPPDYHRGGEYYGRDSYRGSSVREVWDAPRQPAHGPRDVPRGITRVYLGDIPRDLRRQEVEDEFRRVGPVVSVQLHSNATANAYGFVEFEDPRDAMECVRRYHGRACFSSRPIRVELTKGVPKERTRDNGPGASASGTQKRTEFRVLVIGVSQDTQWQDLKDFGRAVSVLAVPLCSAHFPRSSPPSSPSHPTHPRPAK